MSAEPPSGGAVSLVVLVGQTVEWAIEATNVLNAHRAAEWKGEPPIDVAALWGLRWEGGSDPARIVVVETRAGTCAFCSVRLLFRSVDRNEILPLPHIVARGRMGRLIRGVVLGESEPAVLVLNPDAFVNEWMPPASDSWPGTKV